MTKQSTDITIVQLGKLMSLSEVSNRNMGEGFLKGIEMTQKHLCHQRPPYQHRLQLTKAVNAEHTAHPTG